MQHFAQLSSTARTQLFAKEPEPFTRSSPSRHLAMALGATLYTPATRNELATSITEQARRGVTSMVLCLEDSISDRDVPMAEDNLVQALKDHAHANHEGPLLFVRVRSPEQVTALCRRLGDGLAALTGFVLPKFDELSGERYLRAVIQAEFDHARPLYCMPVLESERVCLSEHRQACLTWILRTLRAHRDRILAVRIGATDISGVFGLRRQPDTTVYDLRVVALVLADIISYLGRADDGFVITGPVWEYFSSAERIFRPRLRQTIFAEHQAEELRRRLMSRDMDGLIREVELDKANGIQGKTVIHPSHVPVVHSLFVVTHEEYADAKDIVATAAAGGVAASGYRNKMNESRPHLAWARRTLARARAFGVANKDTTFVDVLAESLIA
ncbi:MAG: HpcH/HpaI aldolase/citrate lyase family protein [Actinomycetales bacterium]